MAHYPLEQPRTLPDVNVVCRTVPVEAQLALPRKLARVHDGVTHKGVYDVPRMYIDDDQRVDFASDLIRQVRAYLQGKACRQAGTK
eukprot:1158274-Pelagomonas_calceolata.AAC.27